METENRVLLIEGYAEEDGIKIKYELPKITSDVMVDFYRAFIVQLCQHIGQLEGAHQLFTVVEDNDGADD